MYQSNPIKVILFRTNEEHEQQSLKDHAKSLLACLLLSRWSPSISQWLVFSIKFCTAKHFWCRKVCSTYPFWNNLPKKASLAIEMHLWILHIFKPKNVQYGYCNRLRTRLLLKRSPFRDPSLDSNAHTKKTK